MPEAEGAAGDAPTARKAMLIDAVEAYNAVAREIRRLARDWPEEWKKNYVGCRRQLQERLQHLTACAEACVADDDGDLRELLRHNGNTLRAALALHQAMWPVVKIQPDNEDYKRSMTGIVEAQEAFFKSLDRILGTNVPRT